MLHSYATHPHCTLSQLYIITPVRYTIARITRIRSIHVHYDVRVPFRREETLSKINHSQRRSTRKEKKRKEKERRCYFLRKLRERFLSKDSFLFTAYSKDDVLSNDRRKYSTIHQVFLYSSVVEVYLLRPEVTSCYTSNMP